MCKPGLFILYTRLNWKLNLQPVTLPGDKIILTLTQEYINLDLTTAATPLSEALPWRLFLPGVYIMEYSKPACSEEEHLKIMEERGLQIPDPDKAIHYLKYIGYYRLTG